MKSNISARGKAVSTGVGGVPAPSWQTRRHQRANPRRGFARPLLKRLTYLKRDAGRDEVNPNTRLEYGAPTSEMLPGADHLLPGIELCPMSVGVDYGDSI